MSKIFKNALLLSSGALCSLAAVSCSSDFKDEAYPETALRNLSQIQPAPTAAVPETAYKDFKWSDSILAVEASLKDKHPWTGDAFGVYAKDRYIDDVLLDLHDKSSKSAKDGEKQDPDKALEEAKKLLAQADRDDFIIKEISFQSGKSDVALYWFEVNDPKRPSRLVDKIVWSKMCMVRIVYYDPPVAFDKVLVSEKARFGEPSTKDLKDSGLWKWYKKGVEPRASYHPEKEYLWRKDGLTVAAYDWRNPKEKSGKNEICIRNDGVFKEFADQIRARVEAVSKDKASKTEESAKQALSR